MNREIVSRQDAHLRGLNRFYTGKPCKRGHYSERYTVSGNCIACQVFKMPERGLRGRNVGFPAVGLVFNAQPPPLPEEIEAAFRMIEAYGWHDHCINELRKNPALLEQFAVPLTAQEQAQMLMKLEKTERIRQAVQRRATGESVTQITEPAAVPADTTPHEHDEP